MQDYLHFIIGFGEVGRSLEKVLSVKYRTFPIDRDMDWTGGKRKNVIHICLPYSKEFVATVKDYIKELQPSLVVIHSTVPIGTTRKIGKLAVHSPIRGVHPNLEKGIKIFYKYFGANTACKARMAMDIFEPLGIDCSYFGKPENTEALKLLDTTAYAWSIIYEKLVWDYCKKYKLDFHFVYTLATLSYNHGYQKLEMNQVVRPVLKHYSGPIGGHCLIPNAKLLKDFEAAKLILKINSRYEKEKIRNTSKTRRGLRVK